MTRVVVVGGDAAGMSAAATARRRDPSLEIVAFERGSYTSYSACGLPYLVAGVVHDAEQLVARSPEEHRARGVDVRTRHEVLAIDVDAATVRVRELDGGARDRDEPYDRLVLATGAVPVRPSLEGTDTPGVFGIQTMADGLALLDWLAATGPRRAVVVGGGYVGLEMAEALQRRGAAVTLVDHSSQPMATLDPDMGRLVAAALRAADVTLHLDTAVEGFRAGPDGHVRAVSTSAGELEADVVVLGLGVRPDSALARAAGLAVGEHGGVTVDDEMHASADGVYAAGDCVETWHRVSRRPVAIALGTHANKQGRVVGENVAGGHARFPGVIGTAATQVCAYEVARTGLTEAEADAAGIDAVAATIESSTRAGYYPGAALITVKMVAERSSGRILGAQIIGAEGAAKRIDVVAAGIWNEMDVAEFAMMDLAYGPPFAPVWDPVLIAARRAAELV